MIFFTCLGIGLVIFLGLYLTKRIYMSVQWGKLKREIEKVNAEPLTKEELLFEYDFLKSQELYLNELELSLFPYIKTKSKRYYNENEKN